MFTAPDVQALLTIHHLRAAELRAEAAADRLTRSLPRPAAQRPDPERARSRLGRLRRFARHPGPGDWDPGQGRPGPGQTRATALP